MKHKKFLLIYIFLIFVVILSSIKTTLDSFYSYYQKFEKNNTVNNVITSIYEIKPIRIFSSYSGFETGYGFFGTNVSSDFVVIYELTNSTGQTYSNKLKLNTKEGSIRFMSLNRLFLDQLTNKTNKDYDKFIEIILRQISKYIYKKHKGNYHVHLKIYLYHYPSLQQYKNGNRKTKLFLFKEIYYK